MTDDASKLGPTGEYPKGKINETDDGELAMQVGAYMTPAGPKVRLDFGTQVKWMAMDPPQARELGRMLKKAADFLDKQKAKLNG